MDPRTIEPARATRPPSALDLDLVGLRALVAIADTGTFSAAAERTARTQSAVSLQIRKLEERLGVRLLDRTSRSVSPTVAGETLIGYARRLLAVADEAVLAVSAPGDDAPLRVGFAEYLVPAHLHALLARFARAHAAAPLSLVIGTGVELAASLARGELDLVIGGPDVAGEGGGHAGAAGVRVLREEPLVWVGSREADAPAVPARGPLPLVLMAPPCSYRAAMIDALERSGRPWRASVETSGVQGVGAAVAAGLGISALARSAVGPDVRALADGLPALPATAMVARERVGRSHPLAARLTGWLTERLPGARGVAPAGRSSLS